MSELTSWTFILKCEPHLTSSYIHPNLQITSPLLSALPNLFQCRSTIFISPQISLLDPYQLYELLSLISKNLQYCYKLKILGLIKKKNLVLGLTQENSIEYSVQDSLSTLYTKSTWSMLATSNLP